MSALSGARTLAIIETQSAIASASLALDGVIALVVSRAREISGATAGAVELIDGEELVHHAVSGTAESFAGLRSAVTTGLSGRCLRQNEVLLCVDSENDPRVDGEACLRAGARSILCVPLAHGNRVVGVLKVCHPEPHAFGEDDVATLRVLSGIIATAMAQAAELELPFPASRDAVTGLPNRRVFDQQLEREITRAGRYQGRLTLCLADLDGLEAVNELQGRAAGDGVLRAVADILKRLRDTDQAFRFGDAEFAVIFPGVDYVNARKAVRRAQAAVQHDPACLGVGLAWGLADLAAHDASTLVMRADAALYKSKGDRPPARASSVTQREQITNERDQIASGVPGAQR